MTIKGLMVDPITNMPIIILRDQDGQKRAADLGGGLRGQRHRAADREHPDAAADDARPAAQRHSGSAGDGGEDGRLRSQGQHVLRAHPSADAGGPVAIDARPSDAIALALRTRAPILVDEHVIDNAKTVDFTNEKQDADRLQQWLESLDPDELGKYKM